MSIIKETDIMGLTSIEICAGAGGQALGLSMAGFEHLALVEYEKEYCDTLKRNRPDWNVICDDVKNFSGIPYRGKVDLLAGGVPCPPFSVAGKQLGSNDERDLFPEALRLIKEVNPDIPVVALSAYAFDENIREARDAGCDEFMAKPFRVEDLLDTVQRYVNQ